MRLTGVELDGEIERLAPGPREVTQERVELGQKIIGRLEIDEALVVHQSLDDIPGGLLLRLTALATEAVGGHNSEPLLEQIGVGENRVDALPGGLNDILQLPHIAARLQEGGAAVLGAVAGDGQQGLLMGHVVLAETHAKLEVREDATTLLVGRLRIDSRRVDELDALALGQEDTIDSRHSHLQI